MMTLMVVAEVFSQPGAPPGGPGSGDLPIGGGKELNIGLFLQGLYAGNMMMNPASDENGPKWGADVADMLTIELHDQVYTNVVAIISNGTLKTNGSITVFLHDSLDGSYYITIRHRNSILTVSSNPVSFAAGTVNYSFYPAPGKAYGNNMAMLEPGVYGIYAGDVNQDDVVDSSDMGLVDNASNAFLTGYLAADVNGDGIIDSNDMGLVDNNANLFVMAVTP